MGGVIAARRRSVQSCNMQNVKMNVEFPHLTCNLQIMLPMLVMTWACHTS